MRFSQVKAMRIPKGSAQEIRHKGKTLWNSIRARYVSLGDSIAAGHSINDDWEKNYGERSQYGENSNTQTVIVPNSYTDLIHTELIQRYGGTVNATSFAHSGDTVADLMEKLNHTEVRNAIAKADYVTVCIGANSILGCVTMERFSEYVTTGNLSSIEAEVEGNLAVLANDNNAYSYKALFDKLSAINPNAKFVFTTIYNPYKYLWLAEGREGFFKPLLDTIPHWDYTVPIIDKTYNIDGLIKEGLLQTPTIQTLFNRVNGLGAWVENYVTRLNGVLQTKISAYQAVNSNFSVAETKAAFDTYPDRPVAADVHYNDLVNVEFTRGYDTAQMDWALLWRTAGKSREKYFYDLITKHLYWINALPSINPADYVDFDLNAYAAEIGPQIVDLLIAPNVDPHPEEHGQYVMKTVFANTMY